MGSKIGGPLFKFVRNTLAHFPIFETWYVVWASKELVNWQKESLTIDCFLNKYAGQDKVKYRFWEADKERMVYMNIHFPREYGNNKIHLKKYDQRKRRGETFTHNDAPNA